MAATKSSEVTAMRPGTHAPKYDRLIALAKQVTPAATIVVHPCDETSLRGRRRGGGGGHHRSDLCGARRRSRPLRASTTRYQPF